MHLRSRTIAAGVWLSAGAIGFTTDAVSANTPPVFGDRPVVRIAPERAVGGISTEEYFDLQRELLALITAEMPDGTLGAPIRVELTHQERVDLAAPAARGAGPAPLRIGLVKSILPAVEVERGQGFNRGVVEKTEDGGYVWAVTVTSPGAQAIRVHFKNFSLPPKAEMYFFTLEGGAHGPYTGTGRNGNGDFWTRSVSSDTGVILLRVSGRATPADRQKVSFVISDLGHINGRVPVAVPRSHDSWPCSGNAPCVVDANCVNGTPADVAKDAVAKMEWLRGASIFTCSGGLVADTDPNTGIPLFLTANHCLSRDTSNLEAFFFYTTTSCEGTCPDNIFGGTPPPPSTIGVTVLATGTGGDFTLLQLDQSPPAGTRYLGWNSSPIAFTDGADLYRISNPNFGPQAFSHHQVDTSAGACLQWPRGERIYSRDVTGATMAGSSGAPVVNGAGEIVGQLSGCCGFDCGNVCNTADNATVDGALAFYFDEVAPFLDPGVACSADSECDDGNACNGLETCSSGSCQSGTPVNCNDGSACTVDSCDPGTGVCSNNPISCDDGDACTDDECDTVAGCIHTPLECDAGFVCVEGSCEIVCEVMDTDGDGDIDLRDYAVWQNCFSGPGE